MNQRPLLSNRLAMLNDCIWVTGTAQLTAGGAQHRTLAYRLGRASLRVKATAAVAGMAPMMHPAAIQMVSITNMTANMPASCHEAISQG
ncbi:hypothetical protein [Sphingomonas sp. Leaf339]|uniref:hypothetical protein n=1 Tax=Sphingomonas sp. Leaf339 TaxID=1736343 RepID=UPI0012E39E2A|nr:hypothetical protein [Sphingomonas sp. Leaf339]